MKKFKTLTILAALMLLISTPILAQTPEDPMDVDDTQQDEMVETDAQFQADDDEGIDARAEVSIDDEPELNDNELEQETDVDLEAEADLDNDFENDDELPQTATPLALLALLGSAGAGTAFGLRRLRK